MRSGSVCLAHHVHPDLLWSLQYECLYPIRDISFSLFLDRTSFQFYSLVYWNPSSPNVHLYVCRRWRKSFSFSAREQHSNALEHVTKAPWFPSVTTGRYYSTKGWAQSLDSAHNEGWSKEPIPTECTSALLIFCVVIFPISWLKYLCTKRKYKNISSSALRLYFMYTY